MPMHRNNRTATFKGKRVTHHSLAGNKVLELWHENPSFVTNTKRQRERAKAARRARRKQRK